MSWFRKVARLEAENQRLREEIRYLDSRHTASLLRQLDERQEDFESLVEMRKKLAALGGLG